MVFFETCWFHGQKGCNPVFVRYSVSVIQISILHAAWGVAMACTWWRGQHHRAEMKKASLPPGHWCRCIFFAWIRSRNHQLTKYVYCFWCNLHFYCVSVKLFFSRVAWKNSWKMNFVTSAKAHGSDQLWEILLMTAQIECAKDGRGSYQLTWGAC